VAVAEESWIAIGRHILSASGIDDSETSELKSTCQEVLSQALSSLAQSLTARLNREVTCSHRNEAAGSPANGAWSALQATLGETTVTVAFEVEPALLDSLVAIPRELAVPSTSDQRGATRTFDLLLDVELPVSVSFGHAQVLLKDVLKLTTGSIVELDRAIVESVDVVVNNCVIARGEVVVVEGNFGVRIQKVVSREERVRTLR
jgi:flagellar motor switch protein FliN/FliY